MTTAKIEVTAPDGLVPVAYRAPKKGEYFMTMFRDDEMPVLLANRSYSPDEPRIIVVPERKPLVFPDELLPFQCAGIAMDKDESWFGYLTKPVKYDMSHCSDDPYEMNHFWNTKEEIFELLPEACPWLPDTTGYEWHETWIPHPEWIQDESHD